MAGKNDNKAQGRDAEGVTTDKNNHKKKIGKKIIDKIKKLNTRLEKGYGRINRYVKKAFQINKKEPALDVQELKKEESIDCVGSAQEGERQNNRELAEESFSEAIKKIGSFPNLNAKSFTTREGERVVSPKMQEFINNNSDTYKALKDYINNGKKITIVKKEGTNNHVNNLMQR